MKKVTIYPPVVPFQDPEFCNDQTKFCVRLFRGQCDQFFENLSHAFPDHGKIDQYQKCQQCKDLYDGEIVKRNCSQPLFTQNEVDSMLKNMAGGNPSEDKQNEVDDLFEKEK